ncbi:TolC family protein [uncultured Desulfobacter sp.]|uniref:TolC family protein n=1 Tax=uncultured Desulfobacter sp. TaxID=240139 RepID=UPI0029F5B4E3|nr:TolC family protein [uncultured Desulfobacter sp.]
MGRKKIWPKDAWRVAVMLIVVLTMIAGPAQSRELQKKEEIQKAGLDACIEQALENNRRRPASRFALEMAQAQHRQTLAAYWPQVTAQGGFSRLDEALNFDYPAGAITLPNHPLLGGLAGLSIPTPGQEIDILVEKSYTATIEATWLLYDGGMRKGYREQTQGLVDIMKQEVRRTDLEIIDDVKRYYWGAVLAKKLHQVGLDTLSRMNATLNLTETMYKEGAGTVKKTDWLNNKVMVDTLRSMVALLEKNKLMSRAALANTMGLSWEKSVEPEDRKIPLSSFPIDTGEIVEKAYTFNPDWAKVEAGLKAAEGALKTAKSGFFPKLALTGDIHKWWPDSAGGLATPENEQGWTFGIGVEIPLFNGMLTVNKIAAARAAIAKIKEEQFLLKEGIGLQVRDVLLSLDAAQKSCDASGNALAAATENRGLNVRAYQSELVETDDVIQAQLTEALMAAQHYKARYEHVALLSRLDLIVGAEVLKQME